MTSHRERWLSVSGLLAVAALAYWLGSRNAGPEIELPERECAEAALPLSECRERLEDCRQQAVTLAKGAEIDAVALAQARTEAAATRSRIERLEQDVAVYQSLVDGSIRTGGVSAHSLELRRAGSAPGERMRYRLTLIQRAEKHGEVQGFATITLLGSRAGKPARVPVGEPASRSGGARLPFAFVYFQAVEGEFTVPAGFQPSQVRVQIDIRKGRPQKTERTFDWRVMEG